MLAQNLDLQGITDETRVTAASRSGGSPLADKDRPVFSYMLLNYSLFGRVYLLCSRKWIDGETWNQSGTPG